MFKGSSIKKVEVVFISGLVVIILIAFAIQTFAALSFETTHQELVQNDVSNGVSGDFNFDGVDEIALLTPNASMLSILKLNASGRIEKKEKG